MIITQQRFDKLPKDVQDKFLYLFDRIQCTKAEMMGIHIAEMYKAKYRSGKTGLERAKVEPDLSDHPEYQELSEDAARYEAKLKEILEGVPA